ncbi:MAG: zinc ribbon domain-containing protein [Bacteroidales bacterium]
MKANKKNNIFGFFTYSHHIAIHELQPFFHRKLRSYIQSKHTIISESDSSIEFIVTSFLYIPYKVSVHCSLDDTTYNCIIDIERRNFINVTLLVVLFAAVFSAFSVYFFLWFSGIFIILFYIIHHLFFSGLSSRIITHIKVQDVLEDGMTDEQQKWIRNPHVCSACGTPISKYDSHCPECGLFIKKQNFPSHTVSDSRFDVQYIYKEK